MNGRGGLKPGKVWRADILKRASGHTLDVSHWMEKERARE